LDHADFSIAALRNTIEVKFQEKEKTLAAIL